MKIERVRRAVLPGVARKLWVKACGRCEYCNEILWKDSLTHRDMNKAYISHIIAASPKGPRGSKKSSKKLELEFSNLMLLCDQCHNRIDEADQKSHTISVLRKIKSDHEKRIEFLTSIKLDKRSHTILYTANVGEHPIKITDNSIFNAMIPERYPVDGRVINLSLNKSTDTDNTDSFWVNEERNLLSRFTKYVSPIIEDDEVQHYSLFAIAPQPLLIKLGTLVSDISNVDVFQKHREPDTWRWQSESQVDDFIFSEPSDKTKIPVLKFSLSADINNERIHSVVGKDCSIWTITIKNPNNDFLKTRELLSKFRHIVRYTLNKIKTAHGENTPLHIFPAMPVSAAVEFGRVWMPKADLSLVIYDQNTSRNGFIKTLEIKNEAAK